MKKYISFILLVWLASCATIRSEEYGVKVGSFPDTSQHGVRGDVYAVNENTLRIVNFNYDGKGPDAFFWISKALNSDAPDSDGVILPYPADSDKILEKFTDADILLTLPVGYKVDDLRWLSVWCRQFAADFGHVTFQENFNSPKIADLGAFVDGGGHGVSASRVLILDTKRIKIEQFNYDGTAPDTFFLVGSGVINSENGMVVPNEMGSMEKLGEYVNKDVELMLPDDIYIKDIEWISVYCKQASTSFGHVTVPQDTIIPHYMSMMYYGTKIGPLIHKNHGVYGDVYVIDEKRLWIRDFSYDGQGPDAFFIIGKRGQHNSGPSGDGITLANEGGSMDKLSAYDHENIILTLPDGVITSEVVWFSVWCKQAATDFGSITFADNIVVPAAMKLGQFSALQHGFKSGEVTILDKKRIRIEMIHYDGLGPDAFFLTNKGTDIKSEGAIKIPDENGLLTKVKPYTGQTIILTLPGTTTVDDIDWISLYCIQATANFGDIKLPESAYSVPPYMAPEATDLPNCEAMNENFNVAWRIMGENIEFEFTGALDGDNGYMAFGISGETTQSTMGGSDVMVVYLDNGTPKIQDYSINGYSLCSNGNGVCPDTNQGGSDDLTLISSYLVNGVTKVRFSRPLAATNNDLDKMIPTNAPVYIVWAMGNVNDQKMVTKHKQRLDNRQTKIDFGRTSAVNCEPIEGEEEETVTPWARSIISGQDTKNFSATIGPTGGKKGYEGITGQISWGIAWYINGYLIPEITVKRGETYTFKVEGGDNPSNQAKYHPFYITDDPKGGYVTKSDSEKAGVTNYAGIIVNATGTYGTDGRYCEYTSDQNPANYDSFSGFKATLTESCDIGKPAGEFTWTPNDNTPDVVYYQCYTHNYLGWKIFVRDDYTSDSWSHVIQNGGYLVTISALLTAMMNIL